MKYLLMTTFFVLSLFIQSFQVYPKTIYPVFDAEIMMGLPRNFRTTHRLLHHNSAQFNLKGLHQLSVSGSGQFSEESFKEMVDQLSNEAGQIIVIDLREESHGLVDGVPVSWTDGIHNNANWGKTQAEIENDEIDRLNFAQHAGWLLVNSKENESLTKLNISAAKTERLLVEELGHIYLRIPVTDHSAPGDEAIDQFIELMNLLPANQWLHFHCKAGQGRTTTFMTLLDIIRNSHEVSLEDILDRQEFIGGAKLKETNKKNDERSQLAQDRLDFINKFYQYTKEVPNLTMSWSDWSEQQRMHQFNTALF